MAKSEKKKSIWLKLFIAFVVLCSLISIATGVGIIYSFNLSAREWRDIRRAEKIGNECNKSCSHLLGSEHGACLTACYEKRGEIWKK